MKSFKTEITFAALTLCLGLTTTAIAQHTASPRPAEPTLDAGNLRAFIELARADLKTEKTLIIAQNISFTEDEAFDFWPLHSEYNLALNKLLDERLELLAQYASTYKAMTDQQAARRPGWRAKFLIWRRSART